MRRKGIKFDVKQVMAHRTNKEKVKMALFEKFVMEGNEAAEWLANAGADLDGGASATINVATAREEWMEVYAALLFTAWSIFGVVATIFEA